MVAHASSPGVLEVMQEWGFEASLEIIEFQADLDYMSEDYVSCFM